MIDPTLKFQQNPDKTFVVTFTLTVADISTAHQSVLKSLQKDFETKGFRKGKAPLEVVQKHFPEEKVIEEILSQLISHQYSHVIEDHHLHPVIQPQVKILNPPVTLDKDWQVELTGCELPEIKLDSKYQAEIKKINASSDNDNQKLTHMLETLVKFSQVNIPDILVKADVNKKLGDLVDQTAQAGITVTQYLKSRNQTLEQYQSTLEVQVKNEWITNLAIDAIARSQKLEVSQKEVDDLVAKNQQLSSNLNLVYYLLTQQKVFDFLKKL